MSLGLATIILTGIGASWAVPGIYTQVNFAAGPTTGAPGGQTALIMGNKTTAGTATVDTVVYGPDTPTPCQSESDVITLFGAGSQCHRAWRRFVKVNKTTSIYFIAVKESTGAAATGVVQVATTATSAGNVRFYYGDEFVDTSVASGDTATTIGGNIATSINNNVNWALTAVNVAGVVTLTAKNKGPEGNWIKYGIFGGPGFAPGGTTFTSYGTTWAISTVYAPGAFVQPITATGYYYQESVRAPASGTGATNTQSVNASVITGVTGATADWVGQSFVVTDASHSANTGTFTITSASTAAGGTVGYTNAIPGVNSTTINWSVTFNNTSFTAPPVFPTTLGTTVNDGGCTWTCWGTLTTAGITSLGGGATADSNVNALAAVLTSTFFNIISCDSDATNVGRVATQLATQAQPLTGILQRAFYGSVDTLANADTIATGLNAAQMECVWGNATDVTPLELAANNAAIYSLFEQSGNTGYRFVGRLNFSLFPTQNPNYQDASYWFISGTRNGPNSGPTPAQVNTALNNGLSPIALSLTGSAYLVKRCTTRCLNGSNQDFRIRDPHKVAIMFAWATAEKNVVASQFGGMDLIDPPAQGQSPAAGQPPNVFATNDIIVGNALKDLTTKMGLAGLLQNTAVTNATAIVQRETNPRNRVSAAFNLQTCDILDQICVSASQVG